MAYAQNTFWTEIGGGRIDSSAFNGSGKQVIVSGLSSPYGIAFEQDSGHVYWTDVTAGKIWRANRDGSSPQAMLSGLNLPRGIAIDNVDHEMFWVENGSKKIRSANLDGSNAQDIVTTGLGAPTQVSLDEKHGKIYWTDNGGTEKKIGMCGLDGTLPTIIDSTTSFVSGINVDTVNSKVYWSEYGPTNRIMSANLDGSDTLDVNTLVSADPRGVFADPISGKLFWTTYISNSIESANLDGTGKVVLASSLNNPLSIFIARASGATVVHPSSVVTTYDLFQNYPNPFNPTTIINYQLPVGNHVTLKIYDILGREVATLVNEKTSAGSYSVKFDGSRLASGVYFYRLEAGSFVSVKKLVLLR